jgi:IS5 family transposase
LTLLKIELVKRFMQIRSYAEVYRRLQVSEEYRRVCGIASANQIPHPSTWTRFRQRAGSAILQLILGDLLKQLKKTRVHKASIVAMDPTFIKAYSKRDPKNNTVGFSDPEARLRKEVLCRVTRFGIRKVLMSTYNKNRRHGENHSFMYEKWGYSTQQKEGRNVTLGYGVHLAVDAVRGLVTGFVVVPANRNEKRVLPHLLIRLVMAGFHIKTLIADPQYSSNAVSILCSLCKITAIIPYPKTISNM